MTGTPGRIVVRRLLVAIDASAASRAAIEAAADLAARFGAEVTGIFVEDEDLLRLGSHPAARFAGAAGAAPRSPHEAEVAGAVRALTVRARHALDQAARRAGVPYTFRVARGRVTTEVVAAASDADIVCLGAASWTGLGGGRIGSTARDVLARVESAVLVLHRREALRRPVVVVYDGSDAALRALAPAATLAGANGARFVVAALQGSDVHAAAQALRDADVPATVRVVPRLDAASVSHAVRAAGGGVVVLPRLPGWEDLARSLLSCAGGAVLVAR